jgi:hypothetical protein
MLTNQAKCEFIGFLMSVIGGSLFAVVSYSASKATITDSAGAECPSDDALVKHFCKYKTMYNVVSLVLFMGGLVIAFGACHCSVSSYTHSSSHSLSHSLRGPNYVDPAAVISAQNRDIAALENTQKQLAAMAAKLGVA